MKHLTYLFLIFITPLYAQFNYGIKLTGGLSVLAAPEKELARANEYIFDVEPTGTSYNICAFGSFTKNKTTIKATVGQFKCHFTSFSNFKPNDVDDGGWLTYDPDVFPVYIETERRFRYITFGIGATQKVTSKLSVGLELNVGTPIGFRKTGNPNISYLTTKMQSIVTRPELLGLNSDKKTSWGGYFNYVKYPMIYTLSTAYAVSNRISLVLDYQTNFSSFSTTADYRFHILNVGLEICLKKIKNSK
jgi:hypothetical protein